MACLNFANVALQTVYKHSFKEPLSDWTISFPMKFGSTLKARLLIAHLHWFFLRILKNLKLTFFAAGNFFLS
jgi:hypothetical protein